MGRSPGPDLDEEVGEGAGAVHEGDIETYFSEGEWRNRVVGGDDLPATHPGRLEAFRAGSAEAAARRVHHHVRYAGPPGPESGT